MPHGRKQITRASAFVATLPPRSQISTETGDQQDVIFIGRDLEDSRDREHIRLALTARLNQDKEPDISINTRV